jgi:hypothetical protein
MPPAVLSLAALIHYKPPAETDAAAQVDDLVPGEQLASLFADGIVRVPNDG